MDATTTLREPQSLSDREFDGFRRMIFEEAGITMVDAKRPLVCGRLVKRVAELGLNSFSSYLSRIGKDAAERQVAIDLLTTNETYFFREPKHFEFLAQEIAPRLRGISQPRIWCGASSTGEEPYTIAMVLAQALGHTRFSLLASDISTRVLERARQALYPLEDAREIPREIRTRHCLKGVGEQEGWFTIDDAVRQRVQFEQINLNAALPNLGSFDVIFLRNVMIYFSQETRRQVVARVIRHLNPGGHFFISHSESLHGVTEALRAVRPSIYVHRDERG